MEDVEYSFGTTILSPDVEMPDYVDIHDKFGVWVDSVGVKKVKEEKERKTETLMRKRNRRKNLRETCGKCRPGKYCWHKR